MPSGLAALMLAGLNYIYPLSINIWILIELTNPDRWHLPGIGNGLVVDWDKAVSDNILHCSCWSSGWDYILTVQWNLNNVPFSSWWKIMLNCIGCILKSMIWCNNGDRLLTSLPTWLSGSRKLEVQPLSNVQCSAGYQYCHIYYATNILNIVALLAPYL